MKVVAINGSPHKDGNTALALRTVGDELVREGFEFEIIHIGNVPVRGCIACGVCAKRKDGRCSINDRLNEVLPTLFAADAVILGTPVYYAGIAGTMKCFCDRAFYVAGSNGGLFKGKVGASVVAVRRGGASATFSGLNYYFQMSEMTVAGSSYWNSVHGRAQGEAQVDAEGLQTMRNLAKNIAYLLRLKQSANIPLPEYESGARTQISDLLKYQK